MLVAMISFLFIIAIFIASHNNKIRICHQIFK